MQKPPRRKHVNSTGPQFKFHSSEVTLDYDCICSFKWGELLLGHQVHGLLPCAGKPGNGLFLLLLCWFWLFFLPGCQRQETSNSCVDCRSHKEEVESLSSQKECQEAERISEKKIWNLRQGKVGKSSCSCSTFCFKTPCNHAEEKGQHLDLFPAGWHTPFTTFFSFWTAKGRRGWLQSSPRCRWSWWRWRPGPLHDLLQMQRTMPRNPPWMQLW